jgi:hypothetical protein
MLLEYPKLKSRLSDSMLFTRTFLLIEDVRHVSERYIAKSDPYIVMVSTLNAPDGLFEKIDKEPEDTCIYKRLKLDYTYGLGKIYTVEEIDKAKQSPSFEREYNLKYLGLIGNVFHTADMERAINNIVNITFKNIVNNNFNCTSSQSNQLSGSQEATAAATQENSNNSTIGIGISQSFQESAANTVDHVCSPTSPASSGPEESPA